MAGIGDRISQWAEQRSAAWKDRLAGWTVDIAARGVERLLDDMEPELVNQSRGLLERIRGTPGLPPDTKALIDSMLKPKSFAFVPALLAIIIPLIMSLATTVFKGTLEPINQQAQKVTPFHIPDLGVTLDMALKGKLRLGEYEDLVGRTGWSVDWANRFLDLKHPVLPSDLALRAWLRDKPKYQRYVDNLPKLGLTADDIELLTELEYRIPGVQDIVRYVVKEAYSPDVYKEFGQDQEYPAIAEADAEKAGVRPDQLMKEWISHWDLPGVAQGYEMMHRGEITPDQLAKLLKARDIMPFWRDKLTAISWLLPGRIEVRMLALYGLIDKAGIIDILKKDGLAEDYRSVIADMNIVRGVKSDIQVRYTNGWINAEGVRAEVDAHGLDPKIADQLYKSIVKNAQAARTATQKSLTLAQIEKGVRKGKLSRAQGIDLVIDLGYDDNEAVFILDIDVPADETDAAKKARELTKSDILAGLKSGTINTEQARAKLIEIRYTPGDADFILRVYQAGIKPPAEPVEREISKADVVSAVKKGLITPEQGYQLLIMIGFSADAADFILSLVAEESPFSPLDYDEFKALTNSLRRAQGMPVETLPAGAQELQLRKAQAIAEGRNPMLEQLRIQIDTIRRRRRSNLITRDQEIAELQVLKVPADYIAALVANDDTRLEIRKAKG